MLAFYTASLAFDAPFNIKLQWGHRVSIVPPLPGQAESASSGRTGNSDSDAVTLASESNRRVNYSWLCWLAPGLPVSLIG